MRTRVLVVIAAGAVMLMTASAATAKQFRPGDLRLCSRHSCVAITNRPVRELLGAFYYTGRKAPVQAPAPRLGTPAYELRFRDGYVTGIVATAKLDRFLSYGVNLGRFGRGQWYRFPDRVARELRRLAAPLHPLRVTRRSLNKAH